MMIVNVIIIMQKDDTMLFCHHGEEGAKDKGGKNNRDSACLEFWAHDPMLE